jgi:hypothetical protein
MFEDISKLLKQVQVIKNNQEKNIKHTFSKIDEIKDEKIKDFLKNSVNLAMKGELNAETFLQQSKNIINATDKP